VANRSSLIIFNCLRSIKNAESDITLAGEKPTKSLASSYRNRFLVAVSPGNILFWLSVFGSVLSKSYNTADSGGFLLIVAGVLTGILLHDIGLLAIVATTRKVMNRTMIKRFSIIAGLLLIGFGGYFIYQFFIAVASVI